MDPKQCLADCDQALSAGDIDAARDHYMNYLEWRRGGGFEPTEVAGTLKRGDEFARECLRRINDWR